MMTEGKRHKRDLNEMAGLQFLAALKEKGCALRAFTQFHIRIEDEIDFWPRSLKFRQKHGTYSGQGLDALAARVKAFRQRKPKSNPEVILLPYLPPKEPNDELPF